VVDDMAICFSWFGMRVLPDFDCTLDLLARTI